MYKSIIHENECYFLGNKCIIVTADKNSSEKVNTMRLLGAEVIQTKSNDREIAIARQLIDENPDTVVMLNQVQINFFTC